ncbi:porin [Candidatus Pelagibacter sp.]|nr:porin [Candidatus Pelagibacter sp.]
MNNFKKIGMTALAASLVSTSVFAGEMTVSGSASINSEGFSSTGMDEGTTFSMGNQITFSGSGELDNGMNVTLSFTLDQGDDGNTSTASATNSIGGTAPFDGHSVTVSSDAMGTLKFSGEGGASAASSIDTTAAGDIWDNFDGKKGISGGNAGIKITDSAPGDNAFFYTLPSMVDGLAVNASYKPQGSAPDSVLGYGVSYSGVEGLAVHYATTDIEGATVALSGDQTVLKATYAYGPVTVGYSKSEFDLGATDHSTDQDLTSYSVSYTVSDAISVTYGTEEIDVGDSTTDAEYDILKGSYTSGGMTVSASMADGENIGHTTAADEDMEYWSLGLSFAF